jgi:hypothetical protein
MLENTRYWYCLSHPVWCSLGWSQKNKHQIITGNNKIQFKPLCVVFSWMEPEKLVAEHIGEH